MAAGDKSKAGNRTDYAIHYSKEPAGLPLCGRKRYGYSSTDKTDVDCENCLKKLNNPRKIGPNEYEYENCHILIERRTDCKFWYAVVNNRRLPTDCQLAGMALDAAKAHIDRLKTNYATL